MPGIDELVQRLCPDGVEYKALGEIAEYARERIDASSIPDGMYVGVNELRQDYMGRLDVLRTPSEAKCIKFQAYDVLLGNIRPYLKKAWLADGAGGTNGDVLVIRVKDPQIVLPGFLFYVITGSEFTHYNVANSKGSKMPRGDKKALMAYPTPVPPLEVQQEIVRILDAFTELKANLQRELNARKRQYEHYRGELLSFNDGTPQVSLESVCVSITAGGDKPADTVKGQLQPSNKAPYPVFSNGIGDLALYGYSSSKKVSDDAVTVSARGTIGYHCVRRGGFTPIIRLITLVPNTDIVSCDFLDVALYMTELLGSSGGIPQLTVPMIKKCAIPVPPLEVQQEIVAKLDAMVALQDNLQRQIELTHRQYEHYRDQLLDLPRKES